MEIDTNKIYALEEAVDVIKKNPVAKFDETIELHLRLGINVKKTEQQVRGNVVLPHGTSKKLTIAAIVNPAKQAEAKKAGANIVGGPELIEEIKKTKKCDFDVLVTEPALMKDMAQVARVLGPRGLMPAPKNGTVSDDVVGMIEELKKGKINFKNDDSGIIHQAVGKMSWDKEKLIENTQKFIEAVIKAKPAGVKGNYIKKITMCSTMGKSLKVEM
ncbi:MAG: 50S ribosomal protein L1 [Patescibacteria group bacterium]|nr:50S ribosomal protein L1 [Patescibacteria group bacterium]